MSESFPVRQAPDRVPTRGVLIVAVVGVLVTVFSATIPAWMLERGGEFHLDAPARAARSPTAPREIGLLDQTLLESRDALPSTKASQRAHLERYGVLDEEAGLVHLPIARAMELLLAEHERRERGARGRAAREQPEPSAPEGGAP